MVYGMDMEWICFGVMDTWIVILLNMFNLFFAYACNENALYISCLMLQLCFHVDSFYSKFINCFLFYIFFLLIYSMNSD